MKKLMLLAVIALTVMACPSDDDNPPTPTQDALVGTWKYTMNFIDGVEQELEACDLEELLSFDANGAFSNEFFNENNGGCVSGGVDTGTWSNAGGSSYTITVDGDSETGVITFENNTFSTEIINDNDTPGDTSDDFTERDVYTKQ